jgi:uracil phosphoribosyltransferase
MISPCSTATVHKRWHAAAAGFLAACAITGARACTGATVRRARLQVYVPPHPLVKHWLAVLRNAQTPPPIFKSAVTELSKILLYECVRDMLPTHEAQVETPLGVMADVEYIDPSYPVALVPVLRAGLAIAEGAQTIIPISSTYHVGYVRDEQSLEATSYLNKLPESFDMDSRVIVMDTMLATGALAL